MVDGTGRNDHLITFSAVTRNFWGMKSVLFWSNYYFITGLHWDNIITGQSYWSMEEENLLAFSAVTKVFWALNPYQDFEECERLAGKYLLSEGF